MESLSVIRYKNSLSKALCLGYQNLPILLKSVDIFQNFFFNSEYFLTACWQTLLNSYTMVIFELFQSVIQWLFSLCSDFLLFTLLKSRSMDSMPRTETTTGKVRQSQAQYRNFRVRKIW